MVVKLFYTLMKLARKSRDFNPWMDRAFLIVSIIKCIFYCFYVFFCELFLKYSKEVKNMRKTEMKYMLGLKMRAFPNHRQETIIKKNMDASRFIYN